MTRLSALIAAFLFLAINAAVVQGQEDERPRTTFPSSGGGTSTMGSPMQNLLPRFRGRAVVMDIDARILESGEVTWNETHQKTTIPGRPVEIKLIGENLVVVARFTFIRSHGGGQKLLVAQGQVWMADPSQGIRYQASVQTIPVEFEETVCYFPLGPQKPEESESSIEVMLTLHPYEE